MDIVHTETMEDITIKIAYDTDAGNPLKEWDMFGEFVHWHRRGFIGTDWSGREDIEADVNAIRDAGGVVIPVYLYEHSGQTISTKPFACHFDSGQVGFYIARKDDILKNWMVDKVTPALQLKAIKNLEAQVETLDDYLTGNVYGFIIEDQDGEHLDSCWGFYGDNDRSGIMEEARSMAAHYIAKKRKARCTRLKQLIRAHVPLEYRAAELSA